MSKEEQLSLEECVERTHKAIDETALPNISEFTYELGRWIRNQCGLWEHGTDKCVEDIVREYKAGNLRSIYLQDNIFTHPELPFDLNNSQQRNIETDHRLAHPDNCSAVIIEALLQKLDPNYGR